MVDTSLKNNADLDSESSGYESYSLRWSRKKINPLKGDVPPDIGTVVLDSLKEWQRPLPALVADLSDGAVVCNISNNKSFAHSKLLTHFGRVDVFGSHHFHAFLLENGDVGLHETDSVRVDSRMRYQVSNSPPARLPVPQITCEEGEYYCSGSSINKDDVIRVDGDVFFGTPIEPDNWGMWLLNCLPSVDYMLRNQPNSKFMCWARSSWQFNLLKFMGLPEDKLVIHEPWRLYSCDNLSMHRYSRVDLIPTTTDHEVFDRIRDRYGADLLDGYSKIFISRKTFTSKGGYRGLVNEDELIDALVKLGFKVVEPELLPFEEQIRVFASADVVIGLAGAGMFNAIFCKPGTSLISIESTANFVLNHANLFASKGLRYGFIYGKQDAEDTSKTQKRWHLDVQQAIRYIRDFIS